MNLGGNFLYLSMQITSMFHKCVFVNIFYKSVTETRGTFLNRGRGKVGCKALKSLSFCIRLYYGVLSGLRGITKSARQKDCTSLSALFTATLDSLLPKYENICPKIILLLLQIPLMLKIKARKRGCACTDVLQFLFFHNFQESLRKQGKNQVLLM